MKITGQTGFAFGANMYPPAPPARGSADISSDGVYRYRLTRHVHRDAPRRAEVKSTLLWAMLNPSTADADQNDRTIDKVEKFTRTFGYTHAIIVNLHAYRATEPKVMLAAARRGIDIVGPDNDAAIARADAEAAMTICAWGCWEGITAERVERVGRLLAPSKVHCLAITKYGAPGHPLYLPDTTEPMPWRVVPEERQRSTPRRKKG